LKGIHYVVLFVLCLIPFLFYLINPVLIGADNFFYFTSITCNGVESSSAPFLGLSFFYLFPCNLFLFKLFGFVLLFLSVVFISWAGEKIYPVNGWLCGTLMFLAPGLIPAFASWENDHLCFPFFCLSIYFFVSKKYVKSFLVLLPVLFLWNGWPVLFSVFFINFFWFLFFPALIGFLFFTQSQYGLNVLVQEQLPFIGVTQILILLLGLITIPKLLLGGTIFLFVLGLINAKFMVWVVPFLALSFLGVLNWFSVISKKEFNVIQVVAGLLIVFVLSSSVLLTGFFNHVYPNVNQIQAVEFAVSLDSNINNDWSYGYWIEFFNGVPSNKGGYSEFKPVKGINLTETNLNCELVKEFKQGFLNEIKIYKC
jgi:hypothetical protein